MGWALVDLLVFRSKDVAPGLPAVHLRLVMALESTLRPVTTEQHAACSPAADSLCTAVLRTLVLPTMVKRHFKITLVGY